jgi:hypothetical protein
MTGSGELAPEITQVISVLVEITLSERARKDAS